MKPDTSKTIIKTDSAKPTKKNELFVVGIGSSAGGLDACRRLLTNLPSGDICYILCQHLSPHHESMLNEILSRDTNLKVKTIISDLKLTPGHFYIAPPNSDIVVVNDTLALSRPPSGGMPKPNINYFFESLADAKGTSAIGIILSGSGSDGAIGLTKIKSMGGMVFVQEPETCQYDSMPKAAINTHAVDLIDTPERIGIKIQNIVACGGVTQLAKLITPLNEDIYVQILKFISASTSVDFLHYKKSTISRRLARRMAIKDIKETSKYLAYMKINPSEAWAFVKDAFIVVSQFYRDKIVFDKLRVELVKKLSSFSQAEPFRIWIPGCATGEEPYTIAMLIEEINLTLEHKIEYKIFATDISAETVDFARETVYEEDKLVNLSDKWREKYFQNINNRHQVKKFIREKVVFSVHNLLSSPPFSRLDLVSCRNLLIYFDEQLQKELIKLFHFSLNEYGMLLLGLSETIRDPDIFYPLQKREQIYSKIKNGRIRSSIPIFSKSAVIVPLRTPQRTKADETEKAIYALLADKFIPATVIINSNNEVVFSHGNYRMLLVEKSGFYKNDFFASLSDKYKAETRALVYKARRLLVKDLDKEQTLRFENISKDIHISVSPLSSEFPGWISISFHFPLVSEIKEEKKNNTDKSHLRELAHELTATRENLQTVVEELETANEQLQVFNEELQSANEEYQSSNEELHTVNEELQSTNEELLTVNEENTVKSIKYLNISNDLTNIQDALDLPLILVNKELRISQYTENCDNIVDTSKLNINDYILALDWLTDIKDLNSLIDEVLQKKIALRKSFAIHDRFFECCVSPYFNSEKVFDGCVIVFYDTTISEMAKLELVNAKAVAQTTLETIVEGVIRVNHELKIDYANSSSAAALGWQLDDIVGHYIVDRFKLYGESSEFNLSKVIEDCIANNRPFQSDESPLTLKQKFGDQITIELSIAPMTLGTGDKFGAVLAFRDISVRHTQLKTLDWRSKHDPLTGLVNRHEVERRIERTIMSSKRDNSCSSFLYLDLDQFKVINDTCGHIAGDQLLIQLGEVMLEMLRKRDTLARIGGDEFVILLDRCQIFEAQGIAKKLQEAIGNYRFTWDNKIFKVGASIGITTISAKSDEVSIILSDADSACYAAKESGRNCIQIHGEDNEAIKTQQLQMRSLSEITEAIDNDRFLLYFQEIRSFDKTKTSSWEVLLRMFNSKAEFLLPQHFLPAAERFGLIQQIDHWVLENTLNKLHDYVGTQEWLTFPNITINISAKTVGDEGYLEKLQALITQFKIDPNRITLELTETTAMSNFVNARAFMNQICEIGCNFALDDFGTGMSSLSYLRDLALKIVKIDASFIQGVEKDKVKSEIVRSVCNVAHLINLTVVAEGVETKEQLQHLKKIGVDSIQGYIISKPLPFEEFASKAMARVKPK